MVILDVMELKKAYGRQQAVKGVTFQVNEGEVFGLLGPNGAGKSTTMSLISGLIKPHSGRITIGGYDIVKQPLKAKAFIGVVPQEPALYPQLTARENLRFWGTLNGLKSSGLTDAVERVLEIVGLNGRAQEKVGKYSGGMKRRLNIAAGIMHEPRLLIMDEPTVGVDPQSRSYILETIKKISRQGTAVIYTSHYVEEVQELCERVAIMDDGQIISEGTVAELLDQSGEYQELDVVVDRILDESLTHIEALPGIKHIVTEEHTLKLFTHNAEVMLPVAFETIVSQKMQVSSIAIRKPNLESLFLSLTGRFLRD